MTVVGLVGTPGCNDGGRPLADRLSNKRVEFVPLSSLKLYARNPRTHSPRQIRQIADSIRQFGFTNPILVDAEGGVIAGHGRVKAAKLLGMESVPTIRLERMSETEKRAYVLPTTNWPRTLVGTASSSHSNWSICRSSTSISI